jgi:hypothetical protein
MAAFGKRARLLGLLLSSDVPENRRLAIGEIAKALRNGGGPAKAAEILGVTPRAVYRWLALHPEIKIEAQMKDDP